MQVPLVLMLCFGWFTDAAPTSYGYNDTISLDPRDVAGYRSVAYFVNWVSRMT